MNSILKEIATGRWGILGSAAHGYIPLIASIIQGRQATINPRVALLARKESIRVDLYSLDKHSGVYTVSDYGGAAPPESAPENSIAVMKITDVITYNDTDCGPAGMLTKASIMERLFASKNVKGIVMILDTPGGSSSAMFHMASTIEKANKPVVAFVRRMAASAGLGIASAANKIVMENELAEIGSLGTFVTYIDFREQLAAEGVKVEEIYATESTEKNLTHREALKGNFKPLVADIDHYNEAFMEMVDTNRTGKLTDDGHVFKGKMYFAEEAVKVGLADEIGSFQRAIELCEELANDNQ